MKVILDGRKSKDKAEIHAHIKDILNFPEYYGANLDALYDCLTEITEKTCICLTYGDILEENLQEYANALLKVFREASEENHCLEIELM